MEINTLTAALLGARINNAIAEVVLAFEENAKVVADLNQAKKELDLLAIQDYELTNQ